MALNSSLPSFDSDECKALAEAQFRTGLCTVARAFNVRSAAPDQPYRFDEQTRNRAVSLMAQLIQLLEGGSVEPNPEHETWRRAEAARTDPALRALITRASKKTPIRAKRA